MSHVRQQIRDAAVTALTGLPTTGANVFPSRMYPLNEADLPGLCVYTNNEQSDVTTKDGLLQREVELLVEGYVKAVSGSDDLLDTIAAEVETAIENDAELAALIKWLRLVGTETAFDSASEKPVGIKRLKYLVTYYTNQGAPTVAA